MHRREGDTHAWRDSLHKLRVYLLSAAITQPATAITDILIREAGSASLSYQSEQYFTTFSKLLEKKTSIFLTGEAEEGKKFGCVLIVCLMMVVLYTVTVQ